MINYGYNCGVRNGTIQQSNSYFGLLQQAWPSILTPNIVDLILSSFGVGKQHQSQFNNLHLSWHALAFLSVMLFLCSRALVRTIEHNQLRRKRALFELIYTLSIAAVGAGFYVKAVILIVNSVVATLELLGVNSFVRIPSALLLDNKIPLYVFFILGLLLQDGYMVSSIRMAVSLYSYPWRMKAFRCIMLYQKTKKILALFGFLYIVTLGEQKSM